MDGTAMLVCIHCGRSESVVPVLSLRYQGQELALCSACLPILLHRPDQMAGQLPGAERIPTASHPHD